MPTIDICHQPPGQSDQWNLQTIDVNALGGHENHASDVWPPLPGVTEGMNWDAEGFGIWANECAVVTEPTPVPTESAPIITNPPTSPTEPVPLPSIPMPTLPTPGATQTPVVVTPGEPLAHTGVGSYTLLLLAASVLLILIGVFVRWWTR